jgi:hypothetical protein
VPPPPASRLDSSGLRAQTRAPTAPLATKPRRARADTSATDFGQRLADSIRRAIGNTPIGDLSRLDSVLARIGPEIERARRAEQRRAATFPQRHYFSAPMRDSTGRPLPPDAPMEARSAAAAHQIRGHIVLMNQRFERGDTRGARQEFTMAATELSILHDIDPDPTHAAMLQRELGVALRDLVVTCNRMRNDSTLARGVRCENVLALPNRFLSPR